MKPCRMCLVCLTSAPSIMFMSYEIHLFYMETGIIFIDISFH